MLVVLPLLLLLSISSFVPCATASARQRQTSPSLRLAREWVGSLECPDPCQDLRTYRYNRYKTWRQLLHEAPTVCPEGQVAHRMAHFFLDQLSSGLLADWNRELLSQEDLEELLQLGFADVVLLVTTRTTSARQPDLSRLVAAAIEQDDTEFIGSLIEGRRESPLLAQFIGTPEFWLQLCDSRVSTLFDCFAECLSDSPEAVVFLANLLTLALPDATGHQQNVFAACLQRVDAFLSQSDKT